VNPDAVEVCNDVDDDCNGEVDDDPTNGSIFYEDADGDGFGNGASSDEFCDRPAGYVTNADDCDDDERTANPDGVEMNWNGIDEDCDGLDVDTTDCIQQAINETATTMTSGAWAVEPYSGTWYDSFTGVLPIADWSLSNQYLAMTETLTAAVPTEDGYAVDFRVDVAMNDSAYTGYAFASGSSVYDEGPFWFDVELDSLATSLTGFEYDSLCDAWVDPTPQAFTGTLILSVDTAR
jgi:hypothetical protein